MACRSLSQKAWSQAELDRDCFTPMPGELENPWREPEHDWDLEDESFTRPSRSVSGKADSLAPANSPWWREKKEQQKASFERHGQLHPALSWNFMAEGYKHIVYRGPRCNQINREANLQWDKQGLTSFVPVKADGQAPWNAKTGKVGRGNRYAVLHDRYEVYMTVATAASYKKHGKDPRAYEGTLFVRPG